MYARHVTYMYESFDSIMLCMPVKVHMRETTLCMHVKIHMREALIL